MSKGKTPTCKILLAYNVEFIVLNKLMKLVINGLLESLIGWGEKVIK